MAELVDALGSGPSAGNGVEVRVLFWAPIHQVATLFQSGLRRQARQKTPASAGFFLPIYFLFHGKHGRASSVTSPFGHEASLFMKPQSLFVTPLSSRHHAVHEAAILFVKQLPCSLNALQTTGSQQPVNAQADGTTHARQPQAARTMGRRRKETCNSQADLREQNRKAKQKLMQGKW